MSEQGGGHRRAGWGLPRRGSQDAAGLSWEGEGQQSRPEPPRRGRGWRALLVVLLGLLLGGGALLLSGRGSDAQPPEPERAAQGTDEVEPGACLASLPADGGQPLDVIACTEQHLAEVVAVLDLDEGAWPGDTAVRVRAEQRCREAFADWVGVPASDSELGLVAVVPRENDWRVDGDRSVVCLAEGPALVGSVRGSGR